MAKGDQSIAGALGGLEDRVDSLTARLTVYGAFMPKLVRWHAELMLLGVPDTMIAVQDRVLQSVQHERRALIDAIDHQRVEAFDQIREERIALIKDLEVASARTIRDATSAIQPQIERERTAALAAIDEMRIQSLKEMRDILVSVDDKRLDTLEYIHGERVATTRDAEQIAIKTVDHAFRRLYGVLAVIYLATFAGAAILIVLWKKLARESRGG